MSVTQSVPSLASRQSSDFVARHPQLAPFLLALAIFVASGVVALLFTGLPG